MSTGGVGAWERHPRQRHAESAYVRTFPPSLNSSSFDQLFRLKGRFSPVVSILKVFGQFEAIQSALSLHLVEASPALSTVQQQTLKGG